MRIALVNNFFPPRPSGSSHLTDALATNLAAQGHQVLVVTAAHREPEGEEIRPSGVRIVRLRSRALPPLKLAMRYDVTFTTSPGNVRRLFRLLDEFKPDVVHQHGQFFDLTFLSAIWARRRKIPTVLTVHTALVHTTRSFAAVLWLGDMLLVKPFLTIGRPTVIVIDRFISEYVHRRYRLPEHRIASIPIGVDPDRFEKLDPAAVRQRLKLGGRQVVLSIGHVIPLRDRLALVEAMPHLLAQRPDVAVVVVGIVYDDRFLRRAMELGVTDNLIVTGGIERDEVPDYVALASVEGHDFQGYGLGTASLEVMAAGIPVVSVVPEDNFPGLELHSWENVVIVPPDDPAALADALIRLLDDRELAERVGKGQRDFILDHFSMAAVTDKHVTLYQKLVSDGLR